MKVLEILKMFEKCKRRKRLKRLRTIRKWRDYTMTLDTAGTIRYSILQIDKGAHVTYRKAHLARYTFVSLTNGFDVHMIDTYKYEDLIMDKDKRRELTTCDALLAMTIPLIYSDLIKETP
jgi:hypothetical protein